jgi:hypothetical protein
MRKKPPTVEMQSNGRVDGLKIAKRGQPGPPLGNGSPPVEENGR